MVMQQRPRVRRGTDPRPRGLRGTLAVIDADAALDGFSHGWARFLTWLPVAGTLLLGVVYAAGHRAYYWIVLEDHPVEWAEFAFLVFACLAAGCAAVRLARSGRYRLAVLLVLVAVGCLGLAGEEISWGERVFSLGVPAELAAANKQHELNVHNLVLGPISFNTISQVVDLTLGTGGLALALAARPRRSLFGSTWLWEVAPPLIAAPGFALAVLYQVFMLITDTSISPALLYQEWAEFCFYLAIALTTACCYTRAATGRYLSLSNRRTVQRRLAPQVRVGRWPLTLAVVTTFVVMAVFAQLSAQSHILPGNVPASLVSLYGAF